MGADIEEIFQKAADLLERAVNAGELATDLVQAQLGFWQDYLTLWQNTARRIMGEQVQPVIRSMNSNPEMRKQYDAWAAQRGDFNARIFKREPEAIKEASEDALGHAIHL